MIGIIFGLFVLTVIIWTYVKFKRLEASVKHIPGPSLIPLIGNGLMFIGKSPQQIFQASIKLQEIYGNFLKVMLGPSVQIVLSDPKDAEELLSSQTLIEKAEEYDAMKDWLGTGLLISSGQKWFTRRKVLTPAFHFKILEQFIEVFNKQSEILVQKLAQHENQDVDVFPLVALCALDVMCETSMGVEVHAQTNSESKYVKAVKNVSAIITTRQYNFLMRHNFLFRLSPLYWKQQRELKILHGFTDSVILARRKELKQAMIEKTESDTDDVGGKKKMALLDVLLRSTINGLPLSNMDIREEVDTFMFEGHDTTTSAIAFSLYCLAKHSEVQRNAFTEIRNVIGDDTESQVTLNELSGLNYLELVIKETLRLFPSVPFYGRKVRKDFLLNGKLIPKDTSIGVAAFYMGRDPKIFANPEIFHPERFLTHHVNQNPFSYLPFSAGPRNCIGQKFAMLEMKSTISSVLRNFELTLVKGYEPTLVHEIILRPNNGIMLNLKKRKYSE